MTSLYTTERIKRVFIIALITSVLIAFFAFAENKSIQDFDTSFIGWFFTWSSSWNIRRVLFCRKIQKTFTCLDNCIKVDFVYHFHSNIFCFLCMVVHLFWFYFS